MELAEAMTTGGTGRYYRTDPVPEEVLLRALDDARFAPNGGNRQPMRWIIVRSAERRRALAELYRPHWKYDLEQYVGGQMRTGSTLDAAVAAADNFCEQMAEIPVLLVAVAKLDDMHYGALEDGRPNFIAGASVYTFVQNAVLALRAEGLATTITTLICLEEERAREILGLPPEAVCACYVSVGYPARGFPTKLKRLPLSELVFEEQWGRALGSGAGSGPA